MGRDSWLGAAPIHEQSETGVILRTICKYILIIVQLLAGAVPEVQDLRQCRVFGLRCGDVSLFDVGRERNGPYIHIYIYIYVFAFRL